MRSVAPLCDVTVVAVVEIKSVWATFMAAVDVVLSACRAAADFPADRP